MKEIEVNDLIKYINPFELKEAVAAVKSLAEEKGVKAIIFRSPCIALQKPARILKVQPERCIGCKRCIRELGCPALVVTPEGKAAIESSLCYGCGLCAQVCPATAFAEA